MATTDEILKKISEAKSSTELAEIIEQVEKDLEAGKSSIPDDDWPKITTAIAVKSTEDME